MANTEKVIKKRKPLRFTSSDEIVLLKEVLAENPYENQSAWQDIVRNVFNATAKQFSMRCLKEHLNHMLTLHIKEDKHNLRKSGTEKQYTEKCCLLTDVACMKRDFSSARGKANHRNRDVGLQLKEAAAVSSLSVELATVGDCGDVQNREDVEIEHIQLEDYEFNLMDSKTEMLVSPGSSHSVGSVLPCQKLHTLANKEKHFDEESTAPRKRKKCEESFFIEYLRRKQNLEERRLALEEKKMEIQELNILHQNTYLEEKMAQDHMLHLKMLEMFNVLINKINDTNKT